MTRLDELSDRISKLHERIGALALISKKLGPGASAKEWIDDFVNSDNPRFAGKSKQERIRMALGAYYAAKRGERK